jgi:hypothetical protein
MKYATYDFFFPVNNPSEGSSPCINVKAVGKFIETAFSIDSTTDACYIGDDVTPSDFPDWNFTILTESEFLDLALAKNENSYLAEDGTIVMPFDDPYLSSL